MSEIESSIGEVIAHLPEWLRHDLVEASAIKRVRAEETLAAMITNAVSKARRTPARPTWVPPTQSLHPTA